MSSPCAKGVIRAIFVAIISGTPVVHAGPLWIQIAPALQGRRFEIDASRGIKESPVVEYPLRSFLQGQAFYGDFRFNCMRWEMNVRVKTREWRGWSAVPKGSPGEAALMRICTGVSQPVWVLIGSSSKGSLWVNEASAQLAGGIFRWNATLADQVGDAPGVLYLDCRKSLINIKIGTALGGWSSIPADSLAARLAVRVCSGRA